jgi:hypothetical protein
MSLGARPAGAHLMAPAQGTVNVVGAGVFVAVSVPASSLHDADDDHDGVLDAGELERHEEALRAEIDRRLVVLDGERPARTVRVDLILSPAHGAPGDRSDQIVALKHAELAAPPSDLRVRCDLFGARASERSLTITATRHPAGGTETQVAVLTPDATERAFFTPAPVSPVDRVPRGPLAVGAILAIAAAIGRRPRARAPRSINR